jgi:hypothetical protein
MVTTNGWVILVISPNSEVNTTKSLYLAWSTYPGGMTDNNNNNNRKTNSADRIGSTLDQTIAQSH